LYTEELYKKDTKLATIFTGIGNDLERGITQADVKNALHDTKNSKSPGADDIPIERIKSAGEEVVRVFTFLCQKVWETRIWPADWKKSIYILTHKKGDARICSNNRTSALISHSNKLLPKIFQNRMGRRSRRKIAGCSTRV